MFKTLSLASVPLIIALGKVFGFDLPEKEVLEFTDALTLVIGVAGTLVGLYLPTLKAKLKFGADAK